MWGSDDEETVREALRVAMDTCNGFVQELLECVGDDGEPEDLQYQMGLYNDLHKHMHKPVFPGSDSTVAQVRSAG